MEEGEKSPEVIEILDDDESVTDEDEVAKGDDGNGTMDTLQNIVAVVGLSDLENTYEDIDKESTKNPSTTSTTAVTRVSDRQSNLPVKYSQEELQEMHKKLVQNDGDESAEPKAKRVVYSIVNPENTRPHVRNLKRPRGRPRIDVSKQTEQPDDEVQEEWITRKDPVLKTRSGRISKLPKYMAKDYKPNLDENESNPDEGEGESVTDGNEDKTESRFIYPIEKGVFTNKRREFRCSQCHKAYIGQAGLTRHHKLNPDHSDLPVIEDENTETNESTLNDKPLCPEVSVDVCAPNDVRQSTETTIPAVISSSSVSTSQNNEFPRNKYVFYKNGVSEMSPNKRKTRLKDLVRHCEDEELLEIVMPRLAQAVSVWEFVLLKCERGTRPYIPDICHEMESLLSNALRLLHEKLTGPCQPELSLEITDHCYIQLSSDPLARALGFQTGTYEVKDEYPPENFDFRYSSHDAEESQGTSSSPKRKCFETPSSDPTTEEVSLGALVQSVTESLAAIEKEPSLNAPYEDSTACSECFPEATLNDSSQDVNFENLSEALRQTQGSGLNSLFEGVDRNNKDLSGNPP